MRTRPILFTTMFFLALTLNANHTKEVQEKVDHLKSVIEYSAEYSSTDKEKEYKNYHVAVVELAKSTSSELVQQIIERTKININDALIVMAHNIANKPELLNEILEFYKKPSYKNKAYTPKVIRPRRLKDEHCTEKYSHAWTFLLFAPQNEKVRFLFSSGVGLPISALRSIYNPHLINVFFYASVQVNHTNLKLRNMFSKLFTSLSRYPSNSTMNFLLEGISFFDKDNTTNYIGDSRKTFLDILSTKGHKWQKNKRNPQKWKEVILAYPKGDLPQWQKDFLDDVLKAIDEQEKKEAKTTE